ncbi:aminoglycoside phosphotransferase family protein [Amycolatopsis carbonis]|uniref:Aminoglycoside phosphotransferase family protein n=1 Tax=Amycolatopsis carbonis TaxID=715471 RepID=A0A9Y2MUM4_9PSEU|nr:aminoglycoside phosphotransferase family protein [Amycolatopsis sp. 2-15]WIX76029.1 aminoglycoside phosphotransferase family protein [Amycolatopsis sp. 2-15]
MNETESRAILSIAATDLDLDAGGAKVIRLGENHLYRLPEGIVARIGRRGQSAAAANEVAVARWLQRSGVPAVRVVPGLEQPMTIAESPVTFWEELPPHEAGTVADVAGLLRQLHKLAPPSEFTLPTLAPFVRLDERIDAATTISDDDRAWLHQRLAELQDAYVNLPEGLPACVVHGDAWRGNVARTADGRVFLLDFERCSFGPPEWDLVSTAVSRVTTGWLGDGEWAAYCDAYGLDVTRWAGFEVLRDIRELRMTLMAIQVAAGNPERYSEQAAHRLACLRGLRGERPWADWTAVP